MKGKSVGFFIISSAIIWGAVMIGVTILVKDSPNKHMINMILTMGATTHLLFIWAPLGVMFKKMKEQQKKEE